MEGDAETRALVFAEKICQPAHPLQEAAGAGIFDLETRAWVTTVLDSFASKQKTLPLPGGYLVMNSAWPPTDINQNVGDAIDSFSQMRELLHR